MKLNKKRKDARFPQWVLEALATIQIKYQWTFTEALMRCTEKGLVYYNKQWDKMHGKEKPVEETGQGQRCPDESPKENLPQEKEMSDDELDWMIAGLPINGVKPTEEEQKKIFEEIKAKRKENEK